MFLLPPLRHVAGSTASRALGCTFTISKKPLCYAPVAKGLAISSLAVRDLPRLSRPSTSPLFSPFRPPIPGQTGNIRNLSKSNTRCISFEAPNEPIAGSEPGIDITDKDAWPQWRKTVQSQITAVDFSVDRIEKYELSNSTLREFLEKPREDWVTCRWINGTQLSVQSLWGFGADL